MKGSHSIEIMRPGRHTAMDGAVVEFTDETLRATANAYAPDKHEAPLVVGHPKTNGPAHGWVERLRFDRSLEAIPHQVNPEFAEAVNDGAFKKVSTSFYPPDSPHNPVPGVWYVRHVGFFGAAPVAVKGMRDARFAEHDDADLVTIEFSEPEASPAFGYRFSETKPTEPSMSEKDKIADFAEREAALAAQEAALNQQQEALARQQAEIKAQAAEFAEREARARRDEINALCDKLVAEGRLLPAHKSAMIEFMAGLDDEAVIEFAEEGKVTSRAGQQWFRDWLSSLPVQVDFAERSAAADEEPTAPVNFAAPPHHEVDKAQMSLHTKALAYQKKHDVDYVTAVTAVGG